MKCRLKNFFIKDKNWIEVDVFYLNTTFFESLALLPVFIYALNWF